MNSQELIKQFDAFLDAVVEDERYVDLADKGDIFFNLEDDASYFKRVYSEIGTEMIERFGGVVVVEHAGGDEGDGEHTHYVLYFERYGIFLKYTGWYASYDGSHFDDAPEEVRPVTKTITVYE